jgi:hypothetical protein
MSVYHAFIYGLLDPLTGRLRYVGKSTDPAKRLRKHLREARLNPRCHRECWLKGLQDRGLRPTLIILETCSSDCWQEAERHWIALWTQAGADLVNRTAGGDGLENPTAEVRAKIGIGVGNAHRGKPKSPEHREKLAARCRANGVSPQCRAAAIAASTGRRASAETRAKMSAARTGRAVSEETRAKLAASWKDTRRAAQSDRQSKEYLLYPPGGGEIRVRNLNQFCKENGLRCCNLITNLHYPNRTVKGWRIRRPDTETEW